MATIKSVTSQAPLSTITNYVTKSEKTEEKLLSGKDCNPELAGKQMMNTKNFMGNLAERNTTILYRAFTRRKKSSRRKPTGSLWILSASVPFLMDLKFW